MTGQRLDQVLVTRGLAPSRARAQALISAGVVEVAGKVALKPSQKVDDQAVRLTGDPNPWVSRAALKLDHALTEFDLTPKGVALDLGASTGGFSQVLLARGAARVIAVDVGHGQMDPQLAGDARIDLREGVNARTLDPATLPTLDWIVGDLSFISVTKALGPALAAAGPDAQLVCLIKPQFELEPSAIGKGGLVRSEEDRARAVAAVTDWVAAQGWVPQDVIDSPITGGDGNREYLLWATRS